MSTLDTGPIVAGYDGSDGARKAVSWAAAEAGKRRRPLVLVWAFHWPFDKLARLFPSASGPLRDAAHAESGRKLAEMAERCRRSVPGIEVRTELADGPPVKVLAKAAENAALIVLGASGTGMAARAVLGSTVGALAGRCSRPVVVVRGSRLLGPHEGTVVVGVDGSANSTHALGFAFDYAARHGRKLVAVHAWTDLPVDALSPVRSWEFDWELVRVAAAAVLSASLAGWGERYPDVPVHKVISVERPAHVLLDEANSAALVVVGAHGRGRLGRALLGSVSHALLYHCPCPVAVVGVDGRAAAGG
ncbi:universal stress protein [Allokutzneria oryzae]|uniref:Universal stress protein n=1 Tax=Allokutzneria oryzae TaxID=1378989 RepID=A0ABV5ZWI0_9PSEU